MSRLIVQKSGRHYPKNYHSPMVIEAMFTLTEEFWSIQFLKMLLKPFCKPDLVII